MKGKIIFASLLECSEKEIIFLDENDIEFIIKDVEGLFNELSATDVIINYQLMEALNYMSIEDFLKEFKIEFIEIMGSFSHFYSEELNKLSTKLK